MPNWAGPQTVQHGTILRLLGAGQELPGKRFGIPCPEPGFLSAYGCGPLLPVGRQWLSYPMLGDSYEESTKIKDSRCEVQTEKIRMQN